MAVSVVSHTILNGYAPPATAAAAVANLQTAAAASRPWFLAVRGAQDIAPENTLAAYDIAANYGAPIMEISVVKTANGTLVCNHDTTWSRTATGYVTSNTISATPDSELPGINVSVLQPAGSAYVTSPQHPVLFSTVLARYGGKVVLSCEAKDDSAFPAMLAMIQASPYAAACQIKAYFSTTSRITQAKAAGFTTYSYFGSLADVTTANVSALQSAGPDLVALPAYNGSTLIRCTSSQLAPALSGLSMPLAAYPLHRRADMAYFQAMGIWGCIAPAYPYDVTTTALATSDQWATGIPQPGEIGVDPGVTTYLPTYLTGGWLSLARASNQHFYHLGSMSPVANAAGTYHLDVDVRFEALPADTTQTVGVAFGAQDDAYWQNAYNGLTGGYYAALSAAGTLKLQRHDAGTTTMTTLSSTVTSAATAGTAVHLRVDVTPASITLTRTDTGASVTTTDTTYRGGYLMVGKTPTDVAGSFHSFIVT